MNKINVKGISSVDIQNKNLKTITKISYILFVAKQWWSDSTGSQSTMNDKFTSINPWYPLDFLFPSYHCLESNMNPMTLNLIPIIKFIYKF